MVLNILKVYFAYDEDHGTEIHDAITGEIVEDEVLIERLLRPSQRQSDTSGIESYLTPSETSIGESSRASTLTNKVSHFGVPHMIHAAAHVAENACKVSQQPLYSWIFFMTPYFFVF